MWYTYTTEYYAVIKKNEIMAFVATWMDLEIIMLSEVSQTVRHKGHMLSLYVESKKKGYNELLCRADTDSHTLKNLWLPKETGCGERDGGLGWKCCKIRL